MLWSSCAEIAVAPIRLSVHLCGKGRPRKFTLRTDHGSLQWLRNFKEPEGQVARWLEALQEFDFEIIHCRGQLQSNANTLSRNLVNSDPRGRV